MDYLKKVLLTIAVMLTGLYELPAQDEQRMDGFHYGGRLGLGTSTLSGSSIANPGSKLSFTGGVSGIYFFNDNMALSADFLVNTKGGENSGQIQDGADLWGNPYTYDYEEKFSIIDLDIPLLVRGMIGKSDFRVSGLAGVSTNFNLVALETRTYSDGSYQNSNGYQNREIASREVMHFGGVVGGGFVVNSGADDLFMLDIRYHIPFSDAFKVNDQAVQHQYFTISVGYTM